MSHPTQPKRRYSMKTLPLSLPSIHRWKADFNRAVKALMRPLATLTLVGWLPVAGLLSGCASGTKFSEYRPTVAPPAEGVARIWFYRPSAFGAAVQPAVKLDEQVVGHAVPHGFFHVETTPGTHLVSSATEWKHKTSINVTTNADSYVRLNMAMGLFVGHVVPHEVPESKATNELKNLHLVTNESKK